MVQEETHVLLRAPCRISEETKDGAVQGGGILKWCCELWSGLHEFKK